jgi:hypothetical protein
MSLTLGLYPSQSKEVKVIMNLKKRDWIEILQRKVLKSSLRLCQWLSVEN